ncbi:MAG: hypothetical protein AB1531_12785, partial [Chloroflexota bacterium]
MFLPCTIRTPQKFIFIALVGIMLVVLGCGSISPTVTPTPTVSGTGTRVIYSTGIETQRFENGMTVVIDYQGGYAIGFPEKWEVGAFHPDFLPTIESYARINMLIESLFEKVYTSDVSLRIFAIDTSPE